MEKANSECIVSTTGTEKWIQMYFYVTSNSGEINRESSPLYKDGWCSCLCILSIQSWMVKILPSQLHRYGTELRCDFSLIYSLIQMLNAQIKHHIALALPLFQMMAALGAPDTWQVNVATAPSVTVMSTGGTMKAGAIPAEHTVTFLIRMRKRHICSVSPHSRLMQSTHTPPQEHANYHKRPNNSQ